MQKIIEFINKNTHNKYDFLKLGKAEFNKSKNLLNIVLLYPDEIGDIKEKDRQELFGVIKEFVNLDLEINLKYVKSFYDLEHLKKLTKEYLKKNYPTMSVAIKTDSMSIKESDNIVEITLNTIKGYVSGNQLNKFKTNLESHFNNQFFYKFEVNFIEIEEENNNILKEKEKEILEGLVVEEVKKNFIKIEVLDQLIGDDGSFTPLCVSSVTTPDTKVSVAGTIKYFSEREYTRKQKTAEGNEVDVKKVFYTLTLESAGKELGCTYFPNKNTVEKARLLENGMEVVLTGDVEISKYDSKLKLMIKHITRVKILDKPKETIKFKPVPKSYRFAFPESYEAVGQASLFEMDKGLVPYIKDNTFVVFDLETTGLSHEDCKITEIGAVKIENGKITEKFASFVDPEVEIPLEITRITGITDAMVMGAPKIEEVVGDFYKFCEGSTIVAYNIDFDYKFINYNARKSGYNFNHPQKDALVMARQYIKELRNYKLKTVTEHLGVSLNNAHRAYYDAAATAKVFLKLAENVK